jgi:hypothetical protein
MYRFLAFIQDAITLTTDRTETLTQTRVDFETNSNGPAGSTFV